MTKTKGIENMVVWARHEKVPVVFALVISFEVASNTFSLFIFGFILQISKWRENRQEDIVSCLTRPTYPTHPQSKTEFKTIQTNKLGKNIKLKSKIKRKIS